MLRKLDLVSKGLLALLCFSLAFSQAEAKKKKSFTEFVGTGQYCHDGDTCRVKVGAESLKIRLAGIDSPELKQKFGPEARDYTDSKLKNKEVKLKCDGKSFDRLVCYITINGEELNGQVVQAGFAYDSQKYSKGKYKIWQSEARSKRLGMWSDASLTSPYCYRRKSNKRCLRDRSFMP